MLDELSDIWEDFSAAPFSLSDVDGFPFEDWNTQLGKYKEKERWFTGQALKDENNKNNPNSETDLYPLEINPLIGTVMKHGYILFGETEDDGRPLVRPRLIPKGDEQKKLAEQAEEALFMAWWESNGRAVMMENGILSQIYGGSVFKATYVPHEWKKYGGDRETPILIERINPKGFYGIPDSGNMYRLAEAWVVKQITKEQARVYGYIGDDKTVWYVEHWKPDTYTVKINNVPVTRMAGNENAPVGGDNPYGFVPFVYIPHIRVGAFLGMDSISHLKGMVKELNLRYGDYGDAVNDDSHSLIAARNITGSITTLNAANREIAYLGTAQGITGNEPEPDIFEVTKTRASAAMGALINEIYQQYRRDAAHPAVADGEDEGSQRSAMTLAMRFWSLLSHSGIERIFWSSGLNVFNTYILRMLAEHKASSITPAHCVMRMKQIWAPQLPRDREADVQEWVQRVAANLGPIEHLLELTGDIEDVEEARKLILQWVSDLKEAEMKIEKKYEPTPAPFGGAKSPPGGGKKTTPGQGGKSK